jgi:hypothetical protein
MAWLWAWAWMSPWVWIWVYLCILTHLGLPMYRRTIFISAAYFHSHPSKVLILVNLVYWVWKLKGSQQLEWPFSRSQWLGLPSPSLSIAFRFHLASDDTCINISISKLVNLHISHILWYGHLHLVVRTMDAITQETTLLLRNNCVGLGFHICGLWRDL